MLRVLVCVVMMAIFAFAGPALTLPHSRAAAGTFVYEPPDPGFKPTPTEASKDAGALVWTYDDGSGGVSDTTIVLNHTDKWMATDGPDLDMNADAMARAMAGDCDYTPRRHESRLRADGTRVGVIEGDCTQTLDLDAFHLPSKKLTTRKLTLIFPDNAGTSVVLATYPPEQAARWEPLFDASIGKAKGVALRVDPPPMWVYAAWAMAGLVIGWLVSALVVRDRPA